LNLRDSLLRVLTTGVEGAAHVVRFIILSHPIFQRKPSANLHACQDQVSCI
jgi:hypothetical protein